MPAAPFGAMAAGSGAQRTTARKDPMGGLRTYVIVARSPIDGTMKRTRFHDRDTALDVARLLRDAGFGVAVRHTEGAALEVLDMGGELHE